MLSMHAPAPAVLGSQGIVPPFLMTFDEDEEWFEDESNWDRPDDEEDEWDSDEEDDEEDDWESDKDGSWDSDDWSEDDEEY